MPRSAASRKIDAPVMPPPMTSRSNFSSDSLRKVAGRERLLKELRDIYRRQWRCDEDVIDLIASGISCRHVEPAVVQHRFVNFGCVVVCFVTDVATGERVGFRREAVGDEQTVVF